MISPTIRNPLRLIVKLSSGVQQLAGDCSNPIERDHNGAFDLDSPILRRATIKPYARAVDQFGFADMRDEELLRTEQLGHLGSIGRQHAHRLSPVFAMGAA
jgi:hypothetical protein